MMQWYRYTGDYPVVGAPLHKQVLPGERIRLWPAQAAQLNAQYPGKFEPVQGPEEYVYLGSGSVRVRDQWLHPGDRLLLSPSQARKLNGQYPGQFVRIEATASEERATDERPFHQG